MDDIKRMFDIQRIGPYRAMGMDPNAIAYETQNSGVFPTGFVDEFDQAITDFVQYGVYNGGFRAGPPEGEDTDLAAITNLLPGWGAPIQVSGSAITCQWAADPDSPSGYNLQFTIAAGAAGDEAYVQQIVPIGGSRAQWMSENVTFSGVAGVGNTGTFMARCTMRYLDIDRNELGDDFVAETTAAAGAEFQSTGALMDLAPPSSAAYLRMRVGMERDAAGNSATGTIAFAEVRRHAAQRIILLAESLDPTTYYPSFIGQANGYIQLYSQSGMATSAAVQIGPNGTYFGGLPLILTPAMPPSGLVSATSLYADIFDNRIYAIDENDSITGPLPRWQVATGTTGSIAATSAADVTVTWPEAFESTNYTVLFTLELNDANNRVPPTYYVKTNGSNKTASAVVVRVENNAASSLNFDFRAIGILD